MLLTAFALWFGEFALEVNGFCRSRCYPLLSLFFGYCAVADLSAFVIRHFYGWEVYKYAYWFQKGGKYFLLAILAAYLCGKVLDASQGQTYCAAGILIAGSCILCAVFADERTLGDKLVDGGIVSALMLTAGLGLAWIGRNKSLPKPWNLVAGGLLTLLIGDILVLVACKFWWPAHHAKWIAEYAQLVMWNFAVRGKLAEFRLPLGVKIEGQAKGASE